MNTIFTQLQSLVAGLSTADYIALAGVFAAGVQYLINRIKPLGELTNWLISLGIMPWLTAALSLLPAPGSFKTRGVFVYFIAQLAYLTVEQIKKGAVKKAETAQPLELAPGI